jgi:hypothetical protein
MRSVQIINNYAITNKSSEEIKLAYPNLFKEVLEHDKITSSSWYDLSDAAFAEYDRFRRIGLRSKDIKEALRAVGKKKCGHCHKIKTLAEFGNYKGHWDGLMYECRQCRNKLHKEYYNNPKTHDKHKDYMKNYFRNYSKRISVISRQLKKLFDQDSRAVEEFIKTDVFQNFLKPNSLS